MIVALKLIGGQQVPGDIGDMQHLPPMLYWMDENKDTTTIRQFIRNGDDEFGVYIEVPATPVTVTRPEAEGE